VTKLNKFTVAGISAAILAIATFAMADSFAGTELTACNAGKSRGSVAQWASLHPGLNRKEECLELGAVEP
jgi:hypothetical protein